MKTENLRAYFFANMYLPGLHAGIQSQHTTSEMFVKYQQIDSGYIPEFPDETYNEPVMLFDWAENHKTTIVLNGGMSGDLQEIKQLFAQPENPYPWSYFNETEYALNNALTNVGIILPEKIYNYDKVVKEYNDINSRGYVPVFDVPVLNDYELGIVEVLRNKRLMN